VYYYWPATYQPQVTWTGYPGQYYQTVYTPQYYQAAYVQPYSQTAYYQQTYQPSTTGNVTQASYVTMEASQAATTTATSPAPATTEASQTTQAPATVPAGDPYGFIGWLNATRASYGLPAVGYDPNLSSWAAVNNSHQAARGIGHFVMGPARRQNSAMGGFPGIESMWMASPAHRAALLDPTIRWIGIAGLGAYWTFNAN
jgi:uncharacterized protein YkwD